MTSLWTNRLILILALVALFISTTLLVSHVFGLQLPCTNARGCETVEQSHWSTLLGLPTALYGVVLDLFFLAICMFRPGKPDPFWRRSSLVLGYVGLAAMAGSGLLIFISVSEINAVCEWCLAHAIVVAAMAIVACAEYSTMPSEESTFPQARERMRLGFPLVIGLLATVSYGAYIYNFAEHGAYKNQQYKPSILGASPWIRGPENAPITVVEFGDFECPSCAKVAGRITKLLNDHPGKIRQVFRHYVIWERHPRAMELAEIAEWAGTKGKFWPMYEALTSDPEAAIQGQYDGYCKQVGLDPGELAKFVKADRADRSQPRYKAFLRVYDDYKDGESLGVNSTPYFFVLIARPGLPPTTLKAESSGGFWDIMESPAVKPLLRP